MVVKKFFLCHHSGAVGEIGDLATQLRVRGLVPWVDKEGGFSVGDAASQEARRAILEDCSGFLFYGTAAAFSSDFIRTVEIPSAIEAKRRDPSFTLFAVPRRLAFAQLKELSVKNFGEDLSVFHGSPIPRGAAGLHLKRTARELLQRALSAVPPVASLSIQFSTRDLMPDSPNDLLRIDATRLFSSSPAPTGAWDSVIEGLSDCKAAVATKFGRPRICIHGSKHLTAAFIFGRIFSRFPVDVLQAPGAVWHGDAPAGQSPLRASFLLGHPQSNELVLEIATATKELAPGVDELLKNHRGLRAHRLAFSPRSRSVEMGETQCRAAVEQIYGELEAAGRSVSIATVRLFAAAPQTLMLQLGQRLQGAPAVQLHEWSDGRYIPSALVRSGVL